MALAATFQPDLALLDVMLPDTDGFDPTPPTCGRDRDLPVLFLTARDAVEDRVRGSPSARRLRDQAVQPEEVVARVGTICAARGPDRRARPTDRLTYADLVLDEDGHQVWRHDEPVHLSPTEFALLRFLLRNSGRVLSRAQILSTSGTTTSTETPGGGLLHPLPAAQDRRLRPAAGADRRGVGYVRVSGA